MLEVGWFSTKLLLKGKLLRNPVYFARETLLGTMIGFLVIVGLSELGAEPWVAFPLAGLVTGIFMPFLLKDVKMQ